MAHAALARWMTTGQRPRTVTHTTDRETAAMRAVRTANGLALFDARGRYVGKVTELASSPEFGPGAATVLLRRHIAPRTLPLRCR